MNTKRVLIGTRASELAIWQAEFVKKIIKRQYPQLDINLKLIKTEGDKVLDTSLDKIEGKGLFTKELENELLAGEIDMAVHSLKDLPTDLPTGLVLGAITERQSVEDVIVAKEKRMSIRKLPKKAVIATGSLRRQAQVRYFRKDISILDLRGNIQTRIKKYLESNWDAIILAKAGLERLGMEEYISGVLETREMLPAVGQGALGVEIRQDDAFVKELLKKVNHLNTEIEIKAERAFLKRLGGGCKTPIAAYAKLKKNTMGQIILLIDGLVATTDGKNYFRSTISGSPDNPEKVGINLAESILKMGAKKIIKEVRKNYQLQR
ncbi:hydroxymethylbilane synthase [Bacteroidetes/Chlorobi group bacterium ChocPot_Mid]|jgi:hydroxymethylbilane synthase|nr:MAG: hydroxymethylbilane synthase [Bacteroidetes/Chlorobi group bacterium ChocPot_Mid]